MRRTVIVVGTLLLGAGTVMAQQEIAVQQDHLMRSQGKSLYGVILKMTKGEIAYDQNVRQIAAVFAANPKEDVVDAKYGASPKIWQNKADFDAKIPPVQKAIADVKGKVSDVETLKAAYTTVNDRCSDCHETYRLKLK